VRVGRRIVEGDHVRLVDFFDPNGNLLHAFEWKKKERGTRSKDPLAIIFWGNFVGAT